MTAGTRTLLALTLLCGALATHQGTALASNPIRRVVSMLQHMQKKVAQEGDREAALFEKFMCYCKKGTADLTLAINVAETKLPQVGSSATASEALKAQLLQDLKEHRATVKDAKATIARATALRDKQAAAFAKDSSDLKSNIAALGSAIAAIEKGSVASFLQSSTSVTALQQLSLDMDMSSADRDMLSAFLSQGDEIATSPFEILGILKQMKETMEGDLHQATVREDEDVANFEAMMAAKEKMIQANTFAIESKLKRAGEAGLEIVEKREDIDDTTEALEEDKKLLAHLENGCSTKQAEWDSRRKMRAEEMVTIGDTIKILNDDDALELFKKTLPSPSFLQVWVSSEDVKQRALAVLHARRNKNKHHRDPRIGFIVLALRGKRESFDRIIGMIDEMMELCAKEQSEDTAKKSNCEVGMDKTEDELKNLERGMTDIGKALEEAQSTTASLSEEIKALIDGIKALDKQVSTATENRKAEHAEYKESMSDAVASKKLLEMAGNRLAKFYTPDLYVAPKAEMSEEQRIAVNFGIEDAPEAPVALLAQVRARAIASDDSSGVPPAPPETWPVYQARREAHGGVVNLLNMLKTDLDKEITKSKVQEKNAQAEYEMFIQDSAEKRTTDSEALGDKESARSDLNEAIEKMQMDEKSVKTEAYSKVVTLHDLHVGCDWLLSSYDLRKEARMGEVDSLSDAKAVLSGADYSLLQTSVKSVRRLRHT